MGPKKCGASNGDPIAQIGTNSCAARAMSVQISRTTTGGAFFQSLEATLSARSITIHPPIHW